MNEAGPAAPRRRTGPAPRLTREQVIEAGLAIMATQGLEAVSFRTVAMRLGIAPKGPYTYVADKQDLLAGMFDRAMKDLEIPSPNDPRPLADRVVGALVSLRRLIVANPDIYRLMRPTSSDLPLTVERLFKLVAEIDHDPQRALRVWNPLLRYTLGSAMYASRQFPLIPQDRDNQLANLDPAEHGMALRFIQLPWETEDEDDFAMVIRLMYEQLLRRERTGRR